MQLDAPLLDVFAPLLFAAGLIYLLGPELPIRRPWARVLVFIAVWLIVGRYIGWRFLTTVLPAEGVWYQVGWIWLCFAIELLSLSDAFTLYLTFLRRSDRSAQADVYEAQLRPIPPEQFPSVDVFIATYDEPLDVVEKTIVGALCLDYPKFDVWVLDDGRRPWLKDFCAANGVGYITRPDNAHAKAGNINHALTKTSAPFVALFDADFIVQRNFLMRTIGFFANPRIGIVQTPHTFYNNDPMQTNLALRKTLPDDQRFFFEAIMPSRDAWDAAFCCGSNSVMRRSALQSIGGQLPTESITEDMLLSLMLLRRGYVTRYLCEPLAYGLAPEGLQAFFIQRRRWARGAMQLLFLAEGPFGSGLTLMQRLLFMPTHWLTQSLTFVFSIVVPLVFLWTGIMPMVNVSLEAVFSYLIPMIIAVAGGLCLYAPREYFPLSVQVLGTFQSFKILPSVLLTLLKPFGHAFKVTPKGTAARQSPNYDQEVFWMAAVLMALSVGGLVINVVPEWRVISETALIPIVAAWAVYNVVLLFLVCMMSLQGNAPRGEERFASEEAVWIVAPGLRLPGRLKDLSLTGAGIILTQPGLSNLGPEPELRVFIPEVGFVPFRIARRRGEFLGAEFNLTQSVERDLLIRKLFTSGRVATTVLTSAWAATGAVLGSVWSNPSPLKEKIASMLDIPAGAPSKLPAQSLVIPPGPQILSWKDLVAQRRAVA